MARIKSIPEKNKQQKIQAKKMNKINKLRKSSAVKRPHRYRPGLNIITDQCLYIILYSILIRNSSASRNQTLSKIN